MNQTTTKRARARNRSGVGTGTTSLLMIFTVLCFATLAMLSLSTAASNDRIQNRGLQGAAALSAAKGAAAIEVASLDEALLQLQQTGATGPAYLEAAYTTAQNRGWQVDAEKGTITMRQTIDEGSVLATELLLLEPAPGARYQVVRQVSELVNGWVPEGSGQLWSPS